MDWETARWIWLEGDGKAANQHLVFQRDFRLDSLPDQALLALTADSSYRLRVNGQWCADGPARGYPEHYFYDTVDCSHLLRCGLNRIEVEVHYFGCGTYKSLCQRGGFIARLELCRGEEKEYICTDNTWRAAVIPQISSRTVKRSNQLEQLELYDNSITDLPDFVSAVVVCDPEAGPWKSLEPRRSPMLTRREALIHRVTGACLVEKEHKVMMIDPQWMLFPGTNSINTCDTAAVFCGIEFTSTEAFEGVFYLNRAFASLNGVPFSRGEQVRIRAGENFLVFGGEYSGSHSANAFGTAFPDTEKLTFGRMVRAAVPELSVQSPDIPYVWSNKDYLEQVTLYAQAREKAASADSLKTFLSLFPMAEELRPEEIFSDAGGVTFQNRKPHPLPAGTVENVQALIYPDDRCAVLHPADGYDIELCCDLGVQNVGYWNFVVQAPAGTVIDISAVEYIGSDGTIQHTGEACFNGMRYICRDGWNRFTSIARRSGRYIFITVRNMTGDVKFQSLRLVESTYPVIPCGEFHSSDSLLDKIFEISERTLKLCMEDTFVDCPLYEQTFWTGDARNEALFCLSAFGAPDLVKHCHELAGESLEHFPLTGSQVPSGWSCLIPSFSFLWVLYLRDIYRELGDEAYLSRMYPKVLEMLENAEKMLDPVTGLIKSSNWNFFEWSRVSTVHPSMLYDSMMFKGALDAAAEIAGIAGAAPGTAERLTALSDRVKDAVNAFWDEKNLAYFEAVDKEGKPVPEFSMHTSTLSLLFDIVPEKWRASACANTIAPRSGLAGIVSPFACSLWFETLEKLGAVAQIIGKIRSGYAEMLACGATTVWENFPGARDLGGLLTRSHCHAWSALPLSVFPRLILGLYPGTGCRTFEISPFVNGLDFASGTRWTPQGPVSVSWKKEENRVLTINVQSPCGVEVSFRSNVSLREFDVKFNATQSARV